MTVSTRILTSLVFLAVGLVGVGSMQRETQAGKADAKSRQIAACLEVISQRIEAKTYIIQRLDAGELSLFEAAALFGDLNRTPAECQDVEWRELPGRSDGEKLCRQVIRWMAPQLRSKAPDSQIRARLQELEEELEQHIGCHGDVYLPER